MKLAAYCELLERDLARSGDEDVPLRAKTFKLIWKTAKFKRGERSRTLPRYICKAADIHAVVAPLLERLLVEVLPPNGPGEFVLKRRYISCESCCQFDSPPPHILYFKNAGVRLLGVGASAWEGTHSASQEGIAQYTTRGSGGGASSAKAKASGGYAAPPSAAADAAAANRDEDAVTPREGGVSAEESSAAAGAARGGGDDSSPLRASQTASFSGPECPICGKSIGSGNGLTPTTNSELNEHVDLCLNVAAIGAVEAEALPVAPPPLLAAAAAMVAAPAAAMAAGVPHAASSAAPMIVPRASPARQRPSAKRAGAKHFDWQCQSCTMFNPVSKRSCGACHTQRRNAKRARKGDGRSGDGKQGLRQFFAPQPRGAP